LSTSIDTSSAKSSNKKNKRWSYGGGKTSAYTESDVYGMNNTEQYSKPQYEIMPLPRSYPSLLSQPMRASNQPARVMSRNSLSYDDLSMQDFDDDDQDHENSHKSMEEDEDEWVTKNLEFIEALSYPLPNCIHDQNQPTPPLINFYTSEDQLRSTEHIMRRDQKANSSALLFASGLYKSIKEGGSTIVNGTAAIAGGMFRGVSGVLGGAVGILGSKKDKALDYLGLSSHGKTSVRENNHDRGTVMGGEIQSKGSTVQGMEIGLRPPMHHKSMLPPLHSTNPYLSTQQSHHNRHTAMSHTSHTSLHSVTNLSTSHVIHSIFPQLHADPSLLHPSASLFDAPRRIQHLSIDPTGSMIACADTLGRVQLIDLSSKQVLRIWKGVRNATCHWIRVAQTIEYIEEHNHGQIPSSSNYSSLYVTYLVIHSKQKQTAEIYSLPHGPRVAKFNAPQAECCNVMECPGSDGTMSCFLLHSNQGVLRANKINFHDFVLENDVQKYMHTQKTRTIIISAKCGNVKVPINRCNQITNENNNVSKLSPSKTYMNLASSTKDSSLTIYSNNKNSNNMNLQLLQQLLAIESHVPTDADAIYAALTQITSLADLGRALDLLAVASVLEESMGIIGSEFHADVLEYVRDVLEDVVCEDVRLKYSNHPVVEELTAKVKFHEQVISAYDVIHKFESTIQNKHEDNPSDPLNSSTPVSSWGEEAVSWMRTYDSVTNKSNEAIDSKTKLSQCDSTTTINKLGKLRKNLHFSSFARAFLLDKTQKQKSKKQHKNLISPASDGNQTVLLCDSSRERGSILPHIFHPLLCDIFVFKNVSSIFKRLGILQEYDTLMIYFGEWFMKVDANVASRASLYDTWSPTVRWLQDLILGWFESKNSSPSRSEDLISNIFLAPLYVFCEKAADLTKAFLLAVVCREAVYRTTKQLEEKTYGKINCEKCVKPWDKLLRKLRTCLMVSLRLFNLLPSQFPVTVYNIEHEQIFSAYDWIARDELSICHKQNEVSALEEACQQSVASFNPSGIEGDEEFRRDMLKRSCLAVSMDNRNRAILATANHKEPAPLLLFMKSYNNPIILAFHRALLLSGMWAHEPKCLRLLKEAISAIRFVHNQEHRYGVFLEAIQNEIWQVQIRPIYRAILFGFEDVHELNEKMISPLCADPGWLHSLHKIVLDLFEFLEVDINKNDEIIFPKLSIIGMGKDLCDSKKDLWPIFDDDYIIRGICERYRKIKISSLIIHKGIIQACIISDDLSMLSSCFPSYEELFLQSSLSMELPLIFISNEFQEHFIENSIQAMAFSTNENEKINRSDLNLIINLSKSWGIEESHVLTRFVLMIYELGKDNTIVNLVHQCQKQMDVNDFIGGGIDIVCTRLNMNVSLIKKSSQRGIIGMLDADTCQWSRERADERKNSHIKELGQECLHSSLRSTHTFIQTLLRLNSSSSRSELHALSIMCGTMLKAVEQFNNF